MKRIPALGKMFLLVVCLVAGLLTTTAVSAQQSTTAVVNTGGLNVRQGPSVAYDIITVVHLGDTVTLLGRNSNSSWVKIRTAGGHEGWVNASLLTTSATISSLPELAAPTITAQAIVTTGALNVRQGDGVQYAVVTTVGYGQSVTLLARNNNSSWVRVQLGNGTTGWVNASLIQANIAINTLPVATTDATPLPPPPTPVQPGGIAVRAGPGFNFSAVGFINNGQNITLIGRNNNSTWVKISANGLQGWLNASIIESTMPISNLPIVDGTSTPGTGTATATITTGALNLRTGPGVGYNSIGKIGLGQVVTLIGRNSDSSWAKVQTTSGSQGWVSTAFINPTVSLGSLPVIDTPTLNNIGTVNTGAANVRTGPGLEYNAITTVGMGQTVTLIGRNHNGSWVKVQLANGTQGWINTSLLDTFVTVSSLPITN